MAWEWSHTQDAYDNARQHVRNMDKDTLLVILGEWAFHDRENGTIPDDVNDPFELPDSVHELPQDILAEQVWTRAEGHRTCSNGGHDCYVCPDGCHTVPFDEPEGGVEVE